MAYNSIDRAPSYHTIASVNFLAVEKSPLIVRALPYGAFVLLTSMQGKLFLGSEYWIYFLKTLVGAALLRWLWKSIGECRWRFSWEAVLAGVLVFVLWVGLDGHYPDLSSLLGRLGWASAAKTGDVSWQPLVFFRDDVALGWFFVVVRIVGSSWVVPPIEEVFFRSLVYRSIANPDFEKHPIGRWHPIAFVLQAILFGVAHREWISGILCALIYQGLVIHKKRLGDAMTAHATTNFLLGLWIVYKGAWHFW